MTFNHYLRLMDIQARMQLKTHASKFILGYLWWFLEPLIWVAVFYVVFNLILDSGTRKGSEFLLFLATGKFAFLWFSKTVLQASNSIVANHGLISKINVPKTLFPMSAVQESLYRQFAVYLLLLMYIAFFGPGMTLTWFSLIPVLLAYYLMIVACSFVGAYMVCMVRDFSMLIPLGMTFLLFTSGVFWDVRGIEDTAKSELVLQLNPLAFILDAHRQVLMYGTSPDFTHLFCIGAVACLVALVMAGVIRKHSQLLALKVLS